MGGSRRGLAKRGHAGLCLGGREAVLGRLSRAGCWHEAYVTIQSYRIMHTNEISVVMQEKVNDVRKPRQNDAAFLPARPQMSYWVVELCCHLCRIGGCMSCMSRTCAETMLHLHITVLHLMLKPSCRPAARVMLSCTLPPLSAPCAGPVLHCAEHSMQFWVWNLYEALRGGSAGVRPMSPASLAAERAQQGSFTCIPNKIKF